VDDPIFDFESHTFWPLQLPDWSGLHGLIEMSVLWEKKRVRERGERARERKRESERERDFGV